MSLFLAKKRRLLKTEAHTAKYIMSAEDSLCLIADRALYDLGERLYAIVRTLPALDWPEVGLSRSQGRIHAVARCVYSHCSDDHLFCIRLVNKAVSFIATDRFACIVPRTGTPWMLNGMCCKNPGCCMMGIIRSACLWTYLGRTITTHTPVSFTQANTETMWLGCYVCRLYAKTDNFCKGSSCTQLITTFVSFSRALWAIKRLLLPDVARYMGCHFAAVNLSMIPR